jgi:hypothetical protein
MYPETTWNFSKIGHYPLTLKGKEKKATLTTATGTVSTNYRAKPLQRPMTPKSLKSPSPNMIGFYK